MPIYEYRCLDCELKSLALRKVADREKPVPCSDCGGETKAIMSPTPTTFKFHDAKAIKTVIGRSGGFGRLTGKDAKYYADKHDMTPARNPNPED